eukprot:TRINITY_DN6412_c0_g1_i1.p1 TRINITY_DN6412_c0_g1~~TRINITY_DN6412_c0_g1_i1.p1  ORF type:complete len:671 (+),score=176.86 TRINITY_DN6412_c0_g1_i1:79-2013(+)
MAWSVSDIVACTVAIFVLAGILTDVELNADSRRLWHRSFRYRRLANWLPLGVGYAFWYCSRYNVAAGNVAVVRDQIEMTEADFGLVLTSGFWTYAFTAPFTGVVVDRKGGIWGCGVACFGAAAANLMLGTWFLNWAADCPPAERLFIFAFLYSLNIFFQGFGTAAVVKINAAWYAESERGVFSGAFNILLASGYYFALSGCGAVVDSVGWPAVFLIPGAVILVMGMVVVSVVRPEPPLDSFALDGTSPLGLPSPPVSPPVLDEVDIDALPMEVSPLSAVPDDAAPEESPLEELLRNKMYLWFCAAIFCLCWVRDGMLAWLYSYIERASGEELTRDSTALLGGAVTLGGFVGGVLCGWISDVLCGASRVPPVLAFCGGQAICLCALWVAAQSMASAGVLAALVFLVCTFILGSYTVLSYTVPCDLPPHLIGTAAGLATAVGYGASGLAGAAMGMLIQQGGYGAWMTSLIAATAGCAVCTALASWHAPPRLVEAPPGKRPAIEKTPLVGPGLKRAPSVSTVTTSVFVFGSDMLPVHDTASKASQYMTFREQHRRAGRALSTAPGHPDDPSFFFYRKRTLAERVQEVAHECGDHRHDRFLLLCKNDPSSVFNQLPAGGDAQTGNAKRDLVRANTAVTPDVRPARQSL